MCYLYFFCLHCCLINIHIFDYPDSRLFGLFTEVPTSPDNRGSTVHLLPKNIRPGNTASPFASSWQINIINIWFNTASYEAGIQSQAKAVISKLKAATMATAMKMSLENKRLKL